MDGILHLIRDSLAMDQWIQVLSITDNCVDPGMQALVDEHRAAARVQTVLNLVDKAGKATVKRTTVYSKITHIPDFNMRIL